MLELSAKIILIGGLLGMGFIILRKIPALVTLSELEKIKPREKVKLARRTFSKLKNFKKEKNFKEEKSHLSDDYWEKIRKG